MCCVGWCTILLKNKIVLQKLAAVVKKLRKKTLNVISCIYFGVVINEVQLSFPVIANPAETIT
jgi:hypothetical protein